MNSGLKHLHLNSWQRKLATANIKSPKQRLIIALQLLTSPLEQEPIFRQVDEEALYRIVIAESQKVKGARGGHHRLPDRACFENHKIKLGASVLISLAI